MPGWRGAAAGALGLVVLEVAVSNNSAGQPTAQGIGAVFDAVSRAVQAWMDPTKPGIPDLSQQSQPAQETAAVTSGPAPASQPTYQVTPVASASPTAPPVTLVSTPTV